MYPSIVFFPPHIKSNDKVNASFPTELAESRKKHRGRLFKLLKEKKKVILLYHTKKSKHLPYGIVIAKERGIVRKMGGIVRGLV